MTVAVLLLVVPVLGPVLTGTRWIVVEGGSMAPTLRYGDVIVVTPDTEPDRAAGTDGGFGVGEIVTVARDDGSLVTHRIVGVDAGGMLELRGDANTINDRTPVAPDQVVGRVTTVFGESWSVLLRTVTGLPGKIVLLGVLTLLLATWPSHPRRGAIRRGPHPTRTDAPPTDGDRYPTTSRCFPGRVRI